VVHRVTNLNASGTGSLKACVDAAGPRVCVFEVSGTIKLEKELVVRNPKLTIAGQTAPAPGILLRGAALIIAASDVLVQHIRIRVGDDPIGPLPDNRDALRIESPRANPIQNVVVDHSSFSWAIDETTSVYEGASNVTLSNNIFANALNDSLHTKGPHGMGVLLGGDHNNSVSNIAFVGNLIANMKERNPLSLARNMVMMNNLIYNPQVASTQLQNRNGVPTLNSIIGNVYVRGPDYARNVRPIVVRSGDDLAVIEGSKLFVSDNLALETTADPWAVVDFRLTSVKASTPPVSVPGLQPIKSTEVEASVLARAGARPADRDSVDAKVVSGVRTRTGRIINCVNPDSARPKCAQNAGGWPVLAQNSKALVLPANPNGLHSSGYTNLEVWLHEMAAQVEGRRQEPPSPSSPPVVRLTAQPNVVASNGSTTLVWTATNITSCAASGGAGWSGSKSPTGGSQVIRGITQRTDYLLTCVGEDSTVVSDPTTVSIAPLPVVTLRASASSVVSGRNVTLTWSATNATSCSASGFSGWTGTKATSGTQSVGPLTANVSLTLRCAGTGGTASRTVPVSVTR
jgi:hypothetical protein